MPVHAPPLRNRIRSLITAFTAVALAATLAGCSPPPEDLAAVDLPSTPVGAQAQWVVETLSGERVVEASDMVTRFSAEMLDAVPADQLALVFEQMRASRPWVPTDVDSSGSEARVLLESRKATPIEMRIAVDEEDRISGLLFGAPSAERTPAASWDELRSTLDSAPYSVSLLVTEADTDTPVFEAGDPQPQPIASVFKLYVLGAVADAVAAGTLSWDDELIIDDEVRSLPSGELQDRQNGSAVTVIEAASKMIAISDNTATDLLMRAVGPDAVLAAMVEMGHHDPSLNTPPLTTRELFWIAWGDPTLRQRWVESDGDVERRALVIEDVPPGVPDLGAAVIAESVWSDGVDWFATTDDLVRAHAALAERAESDAGQPIRGILSANPGVEFGAEWTSVGFKGGSSAGVLAGSWRLERPNAGPVHIVLLANAEDPAALNDPGAVFGAVQDAAALIVRE